MLAVLSRMGLPSAFINPQDFYRPILVLKIPRDTTQDHYSDTRKNMSQQLLQDLGENVTPTTDCGWDEDPADRKVEATEDRLDLTATFEHLDSRGGRHRVTFTFLVLEDLLVDEDSRDNLPLSSTAEELQNFVDEHVYYDGAC